LSHDHQIIADCLLVRRGIVSGVWRRGGVHGNRTNKARFFRRVSGPFASNTRTDIYTYAERYP
jgi:hypothetical protein